MRTHLVAIVGVLAIILIGITAYQVSQAFATARREAGLDTTFQARLAADALVSSMAEASGFAAGTATNPGVLQLFAAAGEDETVCSLSAGGTGLFPEGSIHFLDPSGFLFCSSAAEQIHLRGIEYSQLEWFTTAMTRQTGSPVLAAPFVDPATNKPSVAFAAPVPDPAAGTLGVIVYALPVDGIAGSMASTYGSRAGLAFDVTWTSTEQLVSSSEAGARGTATSATRFLDPPDGAIAGVDRVSRIYRAVVAGDTGFTVTAGVPEAPTLAQARQQLWGQISMTLVALGITLALGLLINRRIGRPIRQLTREVDRAGRVSPDPVSADGPREIRQLVESFNGMLAARADVEEQLRHRAMFDERTGLPNRVVAVDRLTHALQRTQRDEGFVAVLSIDLDRFSLVNESLGRDVGDRMLLMVAGKIKSVLRPEDTIARFYGDEFVIVCEGVPSRDDASGVAERINEALRLPLRIGEFEATISVSIGIALGRHETDSAASLLSDADAARSKAKQRGKARHEFFEQAMREGATNRLDLENDLRRAIEREELHLAYQPIIDLRTNRIIGAEALLRWHHPTKGLLMPGVFIDMAEETGLIVPIGMQALRQACLQAAEWSREGLPIRVSVNLSPRQISEPRLAEDVEAAILEADLDPSRLCIEITESTLMREDAAADVLARIRRLGVTLSVDDFGTGYSSLAYLQRFSVDELKIDRSFVQGLGKDSSATPLVSAIMGVARALGLSVVAEGIEEPAQLEELRALDCDAAQGYLFMRPQPPDVLAPLLELDAIALSDGSAGHDEAARA